MAPQEWHVLIHENQDGTGEEDRLAIGFSSEEEAIEYARKRTWSSVEENKNKEKSQEENKKLWLSFGEESMVLGGEKYSGRSEIEFFLTNKPKPEDTDYSSIEKRLGSKFKYSKF
jgi:hypothetical protein